MALKYSPKKAEGEAVTHFPSADRVVPVHFEINCMDESAFFQVDLILCLNFGALVVAARALKAANGPTETGRSPPITRLFKEFGS